MLFQYCYKIDTSTSMTHKMSTSTLCLLLLLVLYMIQTILSIIANMNVHNTSITPSTTIIIEISMLNAVIPNCSLCSYSYWY